MTLFTARGHRDLLARARAALETPGDLDAAARAALIAELVVLERMPGLDPTSIATDDADLEQGRYCVLSTAHVSHSTSEWLERWSVGPPPPSPLPIAPTFYGWFVSTCEPEAPSQTVPDDLLAAMRFGRERGFDHLLFDCDAARVCGLHVHDW